MCPKKTVNWKRHLFLWPIILLAGAWDAPAQEASVPHASAQNAAVSHVSVQHTTAQHLSEQHATAQHLSEQHANGQEASVSNVTAPRLNLPDRRADALSGSGFEEQIRSLPLAAREEAIFEQVLSGNVPDFLRELIPVTVKRLAGEDSVTVTYFVTPDYLAVGDDDDYFLMPTTPLLAQRIGNEIGYSLPTRRMVDQIWEAAPLRLSPRPIPPTDLMTTVPVMYEHHLMVLEQREAAKEEHPPGTLVAGHKKDVIISNRIYGQSSGRVVIYGWHYLNGTPIQPVYHGHAETYVDYSHGIRLVQNHIIVNGRPGNYHDLLQHPHWHVLISDEGVIPLPFYPLGDIPKVPDDWGVLNEGPNTLRLVLGEAEGVSEYRVQLSANGRDFFSSITVNPDNPVIEGLPTGELVYVRLQAMGDLPGTMSAVLAGMPSQEESPVLIVNGFNRQITGNTRDFIRHYAPELLHYGYRFESVTNQAVARDLVSLADYDLVLWILGAESTADRTFDAAEQARVVSYLFQGGALFVSGSEIGWDLDHRGAVADRQFMWGYLKSEFVADAPNNQRDTWYQAEGIPGTEFDQLTDIRFDNGTQGTYNVSWPDVIRGRDGGVDVLRYTGLAADNVAGVAYKGPFPRSEVAGAVLVFGFPFETIYPSGKRLEVMGKILEFLVDMDAVNAGNDGDGGHNPELRDVFRPQEFFLHQNYPNPFNHQTVITFDLPVASDVSITVYSLPGHRVGHVLNEHRPMGRHSVIWDGSGLASGLYICRMVTGSQVSQRKMILLK